MSELSDEVYNNTDILCLNETEVMGGDNTGSCLFAIGGDINRHLGSRRGNRQ